MSEVRAGVRLEGNASSFVEAAGQAEAAQKRLNEAAKVAEVGAQKLTISQAQLSAAMRGLPAQITDIVTSIQAGQSPMTVFIQQGGQIKDQFGGVGNVLAVMRERINPAMVAVGGLGAAAIAAAVAASRGAAEWQEYQRQILLTGNAAGTTAGQLAQLAQRAAAAAGGGTANGADVAAQLVGTARVSQSSLGSATEAAISLQRNLGVEVEKTVAAFAAMGKDPLRAAVQLNEQYNFLTLNTLAQIKALSDQGKTIEAANLAQATFAKEAIKRGDEMKDNLGTLEKAWRAVKDEAVAAWNAMLGFGRKKTAEDEIKQLDQQIAAAEQRLRDAGNSDVKQAGLALIQRDIQRLKGERDAYQLVINMQQQQAANEAANAARVRKAGEAALKVGPKVEDRFIPAVDQEVLDVNDARKRAEDRKYFTENLPDDFVNRALEAQRDRDDRRRSQAMESIQRLAAENQRASVEAIKDAEERGRRLIEIDEAEMRRRIDTTQLGTKEMEALNEEFARWRVNRERELTEQLKPEWQRMVEAWGDAQKQMRDGFDRTVMASLQAGEQAWVRFATTGKLSVRDLLATIAQETARSSWQQLVSVGLRLFSNFSASNTNPDYSNEGRNYPAPSGVGGGTAGIMSVGSSVSAAVTIVNQTSAPVSGTATRQSDGSLTVVLREIQDSIAGDISAGEGSINRALQSRYGLRPAGI